VDEAAISVLVHRLRRLGVADPEWDREPRDPALLSSNGACSRSCAERDWLAALFAQNVILGRWVPLFRPARGAVRRAVLRDRRTAPAHGLRRERAGASARGRQARATLRRDPPGSIRWSSSFRDTLRIGGRREEGADLAEHYRAAVTRLGFA
jgi:hypothetical protein